jgi:mycoredoxin
MSLPRYAACLAWALLSSTAVFADTPAPATAAQPATDVLMYVLPDCGYCERARAHLKERAVAWREIDISGSTAAADEFRTRGGVGTPLLIIDGQRIAGFDPTAIDAALAKSAAAK